jgi:hypothetical protein
MVAPFRYPCSLPVILVTGSVKGIAGAILWLRAEERVFQLPSSKRRGGRDINKDAAKPPLMERPGWSGKSQAGSELTTPSAALRWASPPFS